LSYFLALSSSKDKTIVYLVDWVIVNKEVDNRAVKQGVFTRVLLARKSVMGLNKLYRPLRTLIVSNL
jgi:hypothetical protein